MSEPPPDAPEELQKLLALGCVTSSEWAGYAWKNELRCQCDRAVMHLEEIIQDAETDHNPSDMLERAIGIAGLAMRRLIETRSVSDEFSSGSQTVHQVPRSDAPFQPPFLGRTGGHFFRNYDLRTREPVSLPPINVASKLIHAQTIGVLSGSAHLPDGILVASDHQQARCLFHFTGAEFRDFCEGFLSDRILLSQDRWDPDTDKVEAVRLRELPYSPKA